MRKKICPRPQCAKEYLEGAGFEELTVCKLCGAPLEEVFVEDYDIEDNGECEEDVDYKTDAIICEDSVVYEEDSYDGLTESEDKNCFVDIEIVNNSLEKSSEDTEVDENSLDNEEVSEEDDDDGEIVEFNEEENINEDNIDPYEGIKGNNLILYKDNEIFKVYELKYDEIIIGRNSSEFTPDIDLQVVDRENITSRKHLLIYKEEDNYYLRNLSKKCSVHIKKYNEDDPRAVPFNESVIIEDGDFIVLSGKFILEAFFNEVEE